MVIVSETGAQSKTVGPDKVGLHLALADQPVPATINTNLGCGPAYQGRSGWTTRPTKHTRQAVAGSATKSIPDNGCWAFISLREQCSVRWPCECERQEIAIK